MSARRLLASLAMTARSLARNRIALLLLVSIPGVFIAVALITTSERAVRFQLAAAGTDALVEASQRHEALVFIGLAAVGVLAAFVALDLLQRDAEATQRLVLCGVRPWEIIAARLGVLAAVVVVVATLVAALVGTLAGTSRLGALWAGYLLGGWVHGCYGLLVGALVRRELEGILAVVLLANLDVGWLQNPIYYADAGHKLLLRSLPAHGASQVSMLAAFTDRAVGPPAALALAYGAVLLLAALAVFRLRMRAGAR